MSSISVVVPFHRTDYLAPLLNSLTRAGTLDQLVLVYDGAPDSNFTLDYDVLRDLHVTIAHTGCRSGVSAARNLGLQKVNSEYVLFLDSDDMLADEAIDLIKKRLQVLVMPDVVYGNLQNIGPNGEVRSTDLINRATIATSFHDYWQIYANGMSQLGATYIKSSYLRAIGGFNERIQTWTDRDLQYRLILGGGRICFTPEILMKWRQGHKGRLSERAHTQFLKTLNTWPRAWPRLLWDPVFVPYRGAIVDHIGTFPIEAIIAPDVLVHQGEEQIIMSRKSVKRFVPIRHTLAPFISSRKALKRIHKLGTWEKDIIFELIFDEFLKLTCRN